MDLPEKINLANAFDRIAETWSPKIIGAVNGMHVKLAKLEGPFEWHSHATEDELFLVVSGRLRMEFRNGVRVLEAGEVIVVPHGVEHRPVAEPDCRILLFEPASTVNTGQAVTDRTRVPDWLFPNAGA